MTDNAQPTPIHTGNPVNAGEYKLTPQILTLEGEANVIVESPDGSTLKVPSHFLHALSMRSSSMLSAIVNETDKLRRDHNGEVTTFGVKTTRKLGDKSYILETETEVADGTPVLIWHKDNNDDHEKTGWKIYLFGTKDAFISFARWDDKQGLLNLIQQMRDTESMFTLSGLMYPETTSKLSARMAAARMRTARQLPGIDLKKARSILSAAGLTSDTTTNASRYYGGKIRLLKIVSGGKEVPIAVAVMGPTPTKADLNLTEEEDALPYYQKNQLVQERTEMMRKPWQEKAAKAFEEAGWRIVNLPEPHGSWSSTVKVTWATRIDTETWSTIQAAATTAASELYMTRGGIL